MAWMKTKVNIATGIKPKDRVALSDAIINYIQNRTLDGVDKNLEKFVKYTTGYARHKGVGVNDVDLTFAGEMLLDLKLLSHKAGELTIGFEKGSESNAKAEGNIKGTYGQPSPVNKGRDFLGINDDELAALMDNVAIDETQFSGLSDAEIDKIARDAAREILGDIEF